MRVFSTFELTPEQAARLKLALGHDVLLLSGDRLDTTDARAQFDSCEVVFGNPPAVWVETSPALRWVQLESVGFGDYLALVRQQHAERPIITNLAGFFAEPVAESILAGILSLTRGIARLTVHRNLRHWEGDALRPKLKTLLGAEILLYGYGSINRRVAELLAPFGGRLTAITRDEDALEAALRSADVVIATVPDTPKTRNVFDRRRLGSLKPGSIFVNFGCGSFVDEDALADELESERLGGAVIDVTHEEPLPADHRFWRCPNLVLTQHTGGGTHDEIDRKITRFIENLGRYRQGVPLIGVVDLSRGF